MENKKPVVYIVGPTASGKTSFSVEIAKKYNGEIISGDSMQIYKGMHIASAAPDESEKQGVPHHLFEFLEPSEKFSVAEYTARANDVISDIHSRNKLPIVVGGTGMYISALADNLIFDNETSNEDIRKELEVKAETDGLDTLYEYLKNIDSIAASKISATDKKRIIRAIEIYKISGITKTESDLNSQKIGAVYNNLFLGLNYEDREILYNRINKRVDIMLENGLLHEAKGAFGKIGGTAAQAIGHKEFFEYFNGNMSFDEAVEHLKMQTRRYAKRQLTWFRKNEDINWIFMDKEENPFAYAEKIIDKFLF